MSGSAIFSPRLLIAWIAAALLTFAASLWFMGGGGDKAAADAIGPSTFSRSAIGYAGIAEILHRLDIPVVKSQYEPLTRTGPGGVLVIAEPRPSVRGIAAGEELGKAATALLILPKWRGLPSTAHHGWIAEAGLGPPQEAQWALQLAVPKAEVLRKDEVEGWSTNKLGLVPVPGAPVQLVRSERLTPIVGTADGMLVGEYRNEGRRLWVLADPDVIANHGLGRDGNAAFSVALLKALLDKAGNGAVVFDETVHGFVARPQSPLKLLFEFPFVFATAQGALAILLLFWATLGRFGAPEAPPPPLDAGKEGLIHNAASLLDYAGHQAVMVRRYVQATLREVARQLHAPRGLAEDALLDWLWRIGEARGVSVDCRAIWGEAQRRTDPSGLTAAARGIHQWKGEIIDGPSGNTRHHWRAPERGAEGRRRAG